MPRSRFARWLLGALGLAALLGAVTAQNGWYFYWRLLDEGATAQAQVVGTIPASHCRLDLRFQVNGAAWQAPGQDCDARVGDRLMITYLISDPSRACIGAARARLFNQLAAIALASVLLPGVGVLFGWSRRRGAPAPG